MTSAPQRWARVPPHLAWKRPGLSRSRATSGSTLLTRHQLLEPRVAPERREGRIDPEPAGREVAQADFGPVAVMPDYADIERHTRSSSTLAERQTGHVPVVLGADCDG